MPSSSTPNISIIIVHYNNEAQTLTCLRSLQDLKVSNFRYTVIIIDNGSQKKFVLPSIFSDKKFDLIRSETNLGFSGGNNLGIQYAVEKYNSEYLCLLNNDTIVAEDFLKKLYAMNLRNPDAGVISPLIYFMPKHEFHPGYSTDERGNIIWFGGGSIDWKHLTAFHRCVDEVDRGQCTDRDTMDFSTGCCMFISREVLEKAGSFDERYFLYLEDVDLSLRIKKHGYSLLLCPEAKVWHENAGSSGGPGVPLQDYYLTRNRLLFAFLHGTFAQQLITIRLMLQYLMKGNQYQRRALWHLVTGQLGKQPLV